MVEVGAPVASRTAPVVEKPSFVEWPAVLAGAVLAAALSFVFLTFGAAIGLSATSPWPGSGLSAKVIASIAVFWVLAQQIGSLLIGGYVAGRIRTRWLEPGHEAEFRDGLHGSGVGDWHPHRRASPVCDRGGGSANRSRGRRQGSSIGGCHDRHDGRRDRHDAEADGSCPSANRYATRRRCSSASTTSAGCYGTGRR